MRLAFLNNSKSKKLNEWEGTFDNLCDNLSHRDEKANKKGMQVNFCATVDYEPKYRHGDNLSPTAQYDVIVIDGDHGIDDTPLSSEQDVHDALTKEGIKHYIYSSYSKSKDLMKWRCILPAEGVNRDNLKGTCVETVAMLNDLGLSVKYEITNHTDVRIWFYGANENPSEFVEKRLVEGKSLQGSKTITVREKHEDGSSAVSTDKVPYSEILRILRTGDSEGLIGYHDAQLKYSFGRRQDGSEESLICKELYGYLECWKDGSDRWSKRWDEVFGLVNTVKTTSAEVRDDEIVFDITPEETADREEQEYIAKHGHGLKTPWNAVNNIVKGFRPGQMILIGARTGEGKSTFAVDIASHIADTHNVLYFNIEMDKGNVGRIIRMRGDKKSSRVKTMAVLNDDIIDIEDIERRSRKASETAELSMIVVDHFHSIKKHKQEALDSYEDMILRLSALAKELNTVVMVLAQLTKEAFNKKELTSASFRGSNAIGEYADIIMMISSVTLMKQIKVIKNRKYIRGKCELRFDGNFRDTKQEPKKKIVDSEKDVIIDDATIAAEVEKFRKNLS